MPSESFEMVRREREQNALRLYLVFMDPADGAGDRSAVRPQHFAFVERLEADGRLVAGGPIVDEDSGRTTGRGLFVMRGNSRAEVESWMGEEPFYRAGFRTFRVEPWRLAEGEVLAALKSAAKT